MSGGGPQADATARLTHLLGYVKEIAGLGRADADAATELPLSTDGPVVLHEAPLRGISESEAYWFAMLFIAPAHWQILAEIDFDASCGNGTCDAGEVADICPQDCSGGVSGGGSGTSGGGPGGPGGSL